MKRIISVLLALVLVLSLCACGAKETVENIVEEVAEGVGEQINKEITRGTVVNNIYSSEYSGLTFSADEDWTFSSDEEIAQTLNIGSELLDQSNFSKTVSEMASVYDMMASSTITSASIIVLYENLTLSGNAGMTAEEYSDVLKDQMESQTALSYTHVADTTAYLSGEEFVRSEYVAEANGVTIGQYYYFRVIDNNVCSVIITPGLDSVDNIESMFG